MEGVPHGHPRGKRRKSRKRNGGDRTDRHGSVATAQAERVAGVARKRTAIAATSSAGRVEATKRARAFYNPPCKNFKLPPWAVINKPLEQITNVEVQALIDEGLITEKDVHDWLRWRGSPDAVGCAKDIPLPRTAPGTQPMEPLWRQLANATPTPVGWHQYPWRRTPTP
ncbi:MAG: hypothetical protein F4Y88_05590 [Chloroflexi bacterium]|nr:hypothetical protein [Chloroflexota bacterium]